MQLHVAITPSGQAKLILVDGCAKVQQRVTAQAATSINFRAAPVSYKVRAKRLMSVKTEETLSLPQN